MNVKLLSVVTVAAAVGILGLSLLLKPSQKDVALMYYYDKRFELARDNYLDLYNAGDKSFSVVLPLVWSELELADVDEALVHIEEFVASNPHLIEGKRYLGEKLKKSSRWQAYLHVMQELWKEHPTPDILRIQERILTQFGDTSGQMEVLEKIVDTKQAQEQDFVNLSYQLAQKKQYQEAIDVLENLFSQPQETKLNPDTLELAIALYSLVGEEDKAFNLAKNYLKKNRDMDAAIQFSLAVQSPEQGLKILQLLPSRFQMKSIVIETRASLMLNAGLDFKLYQELKAYFRLDALPASLYSTLFELALEVKDASILDQLANKKYQGILSDLEWMKLAVYYPPAAAKIQEFMGKEHFPIWLVTRFDKEPSEEEALRFSGYSIDSLSDEEKGLYAVALAKRGYQTLATEAIKQMKSFDDEKVLDLAFDLNLHEWLLDHLDPESYSWLRAAAGAGKKDEVLAFVSRHPETKDLYLAGAYWDAKNRDQKEISYFLAKTLYQKKLVPLYKRYLASSLLAMERPKEAVDLYEELALQQKELDVEYIQALLMLDEKEKVKKLIQDAKLPRKKEIDLAYILADYHLDDEASDRFIQLATGDQKYKFLQVVVDIGKGGRILSLINQDELKDDEAADLYLEALVQAKEEAKFADTIAYLIPQETRFGRIKKFGRLAEQEGYNQVATEIYAKALTLDPQDADSLKFLGLEAYRNGEERLAKKYLTDLLSTSKGDAQVFVVYAELFDDPRWLYLALGEEIKDQLQLAHIYAQLKCKWMAEKIFYELGDKASVDFANFLMDQERYGAARSLLNGSSLDDQLALLRYYRQTFKFYHAIHLSNYLIATHPEKASVWVARSELENQLHRRKEAISSYCQALQLEPTNERYKKAVLELQEPDRTHFFAETEWRQTGRVKFERFLRTGVRAAPWNARFEVDWAKMRNYASPTTGDLISIREVPWQGEIDWFQESCRGNKVTAKWFFGTGVMGLGTEQRCLDRFGETTFFMEYHRPNWDFDQTLFDEGSRDLLGVLREGQLNPWMGYRFDVALNRYNLKGVTNAATTWSLDGELSFRLTRIDSPYYLSLNVVVDTENAITTRIKNGIEPLPIIDREEYGMTAYFRKEWKYTQVSLYGGALYDRQEGARVAPIYGANVTFGKAKKLHGTVSYSHSVDTSSSGEPVDSVIFRLEKLL